RPHQGPSRRQGDGDRALLPAVRPVARRDLPVPQRGRSVSDDVGNARGSRAAGRMLSRARRASGGPEGRGGPRPQLSRDLLVPAIAEAAWAGEQAGLEADGFSEVTARRVVLTC